MVPVLYEMTAGTHVLLCLLWCQLVGGEKNDEDKV